MARGRPAQGANSRKKIVKTFFRDGRNEKVLKGQYPGNNRKKRLF